MMDNYDIWDSFDARQEAEAQKRPRCVCCEEPIYEEECWEIFGQIFCRECVDDKFQRSTSDFM